MKLYVTVLTISAT